MKLSESELAAYHARGYHVRRGLFPAARIAQLSAEVDGLHEKMEANTPQHVGVSWEELEPGRPKRIRQLMNSERVSPIIEAMSRSDEILDIIDQIMGPQIVLFHSKLMMKAAFDGTFTPWHQDWGYWRWGTREPVQVNCMLAIDPNIAANGAIRFVDGSHLQGAIDHKNFASTSFSIGLDGGIEDRESTMVELEAGDAVFFGPLVVHGSAPNASPFDRRANTFAYDRVGNQNWEMPEIMRRWRSCAARG